MSIVHEIIGTFGRYQLFICILVFLSKFCIAFHQMAIIFLAPPVIYTCPENRVTCCDDPIYDRSIFTKSIVMQWNLICKKSFLKDLSQTLFQLGVLIGSIVFGILSDKYGRRMSLNVSVLIQLFSGLAATFIPEFWLFSFMRMIVGFSVGGMMVVGFVLIMELVGIEKRAITSSLYQLPFTCGHMLLAGFGYYFRDYSRFQLAISLTTLMCVPYICLLPESPVWLLAVHKPVKAAQLMEKIAKCNKKPTEGIQEKLELHELNQASHSGNKKGTILDLFRTPNIRKNILIMSFNWFVCSYCFYGVSQYISHLAGDIFTNVAFSGAVSAGAVVVSIPLMKFLGRRIIVMMANFICGLCLILIAFVPKGLVSVVFGCLGVMSSFVVFIVVYLYCSEMFPTVVRNQAIGVSSMSARIGSMVAPFVVGFKVHGEWYPPIVFGVFPIIAGISCFFLPETKDCELMTTIDEGENFGKKTPVVPNINEER